MNARLILLAWISLTSTAAGQSEWKKIPLRIPPPGIKIAKADAERLNNQAESLRQQFQDIADHPYAADAGVLLKAVELALRHNEFYSPKDVGKAKTVLELAEKRIAALKGDAHPWTGQRGLVVRGYASRIDGSPQPYGLEIPADLTLNEKRPLYVWLHGRGDKTTDLHFIHQRMTRPGKIRPNAIVVHPFGRHCMGFKSAGEIDVLEVVEEVKKQYPVDERRIVLMGFSMGGAGAWHLGAHYADHWIALSPGAGFAETARYNRLTPDRYPSWYEQRLWRLYDAPYYVRNLFNIPVTAYSGEKDKQIQAARVMEEAYLSQGRTLPHLIGPGMGHKYHPETLKELMTRMNAAAKRESAQPKRVYLQTRTLRYARQYWVEALRLDRHWEDSRIDATLADDGGVDVKTKNIRAFRLHRPVNSVTVNGQTLAAPAGGTSGGATIARRGDSWQWTARWDDSQLAKKPGLQGPIDDAFLDAFLIVKPSGRHSEAVERWMQFELDHLQRRWRSLYRAEPPIKNDDEITDEDIAGKHLVVFGDPESNSLLARARNKLPIQWNENQLEINGRKYDSRHHVPIMIYPNPLNPSKYLVLNSGPTHREGHDRTNSLQNPKLPDWAVVDIREPPSNVAPGRVVEANFFDEAWKFRPHDAR